MKVIILCLVLLISETLSVPIRRGAKNGRPAKLSKEQEQLVSIFMSSVNIETAEEKLAKERKLMEDRTRLAELMKEHQRRVEIYNKYLASRHLAFLRDFYPNRPF